jgi:hypothetical protein
MPPGITVSGLESNGGDTFFCGGAGSGKLRTVRRPARGTQDPDYASEGDRSTIG